MERVRTILTHGYPYPHEHSRHFMIRKTIKPHYSHFSRWYVAWIFLAALWHLPSFQSMGLDLRMNLSLFLAVYISSLIIFHVTFLGLWYLDLVSRMAEKKPEMLTIIKNCAVVSIACCVFYNHCGNRTLSRDKSIDHRTAFSLWIKQNEYNTLISKLWRMHKFKDHICSPWFAPVGFASDYPLLSKWAIYGELPMDPNAPTSFHLSTLCGIHSLVFTWPIMSWSGQLGMPTVCTHPSGRISF
ncbi:unnamed protein product [Triticum turgidum subsp. durum]|uniref:Uncharacterized protein n=1 Tax=Triticum turgidum subsp. durum TaxID=4567 RepID=A0A9R0WSD7_TRITD|nr:unnamed protein product [Triticum turgidum subsp. durum]